MSIAAPTEPVVFGDGVTRTVAKPRTPAKLSQGRHGVAIGAVFPTEDGSAAVSLDELHYARLWPAVDGSREPLAVPLTTPMHVTLVKTADGFALASLDVSNGLEIVTVSNAGELTHRVKSEPEPGFHEVIARGDHFLALRRDQTLVQLDHHGTQTGVLMPRAGDHVLRVLVRNGHTLALVRRKDGVRGRWIASDKLAWGAETPVLAKIAAKRVHLSPDGTKLVTFIERPGDQFFDPFVPSGPALGTNHLIDLETGRSKQIRDPLSQQTPEGVPLGFTRDNELVFLLSDFELSDIEWWTLKGHTRAILGGTNYKLEFVNVDSAALSDNGIFMGAQQELAIGKANDSSGPSSVRYLGYRTTRATRLTSTPGGIVARAGGAEHLLDADAQTTRLMRVQDLVAIDRDLAVMRTGPIKERPKQEPPRGPLELDPSWFESPLPDALRKQNQPKPPKDIFGLVDLTTKKTLQQWPIGRAFHYEAATNTLAVQRGSQVLFARLDAGTRKFGELQKVAAPATHVTLLDPALAGGKLAVLARASGKSVEVRTLDSLDGALPEPVKIDGKLEAIDRAGKIYVREGDAQIAIHGGTEPVRLTELAGWQIRPSPDGKHVAAFGRSRVTLYDQHGTAKWSAAVLGVKDVAWSQTGELFALGGDIVKLDVANGDLVAAQCGWSFALRSYGPEFDELPSTRETACDR